MIGRKIWALLFVWMTILKNIENLQCAPITTLSLLFKHELTMSEMSRNIGSSNKILHNYIYQYPVELLRSGYQNINSAVTINQFSWSYSPQYIDFKLRKYHSPASLLLTLESREIVWTYFRIAILLNDYLFRDNLYFNDFTLNVPFGVSPFRTTQQIPRWSPVMNYITFITGVQAYLAPNTKQYDVSITENSQSPYQLTFILSIGKSTFLTEISISSISYQKSQENNAFAGIVDFNDAPTGDSFSLLAKQLVTTHYLIYGLRDFKFSTSFEMFGISLRLTSQFILRGKFLKNVSKLRVGYFSVSVMPSRICSSCPGHHIFSGLTTQCLPKCTAAYIHQYPDGGLSCISCPSQLNMTVFGKGCLCKPGYEEFQGKCLTSYDKYLQSLNSPKTFSRQNDNCLEQNTKYSQGSCICIDGYQKNPQSNRCERKCELGLFNMNTNSCFYCQEGTFPSDRENICKACNENCAVCASEKTCRTCKLGFYIQSDLSCKEICGDGRRIISNCDDGNGRSGDGCSMGCEVEDGFRCSGGSERTADLCFLVEYKLKRVNMQIISQTVIIDYEITPTPATEYTQQQLKQMFQYFISPSNSQFYPDQTSITQQVRSSRGYFRIYFVYGNSVRSSFYITIVLKLPGNTLTDRVLANFMPTYSRPVAPTISVTPMVNNQSGDFLG